MPFSQNRNYYLLCTVDLAVANFDPKVLVAITAGDNRGSIAGVGFLSACNATFSASNRNWHWNFSHNNTLRYV